MEDYYDIESIFDPERIEAYMHKSSAEDRIMYADRYLSQYALLEGELENATEQYNRLIGKRDVALKASETFEPIVFGGDIDRMSARAVNAIYAIDEYGPKYLKIQEECRFKKSCIEMSLQLLPHNDDNEYLDANLISNRLKLIKEDDLGLSGLNFFKTILKTKYLSNRFNPDNRDVCKKLNINRTQAKRYLERALKYVYVPEEVFPDCFSGYY